MENCPSVTGNLPLMRSKKEFVRGDLHKRRQEVGRGQR